MNTDQKAWRPPPPPPPPDREYEFRKERAEFWKQCVIAQLRSGNSYHAEGRADFFLGQFDDRFITLSKAKPAEDETK